MEEEAEKDIADHFGLGTEVSTGGLVGPMSRVLWPLCLFLICSLKSSKYPI